LSRAHTALVSFPSCAQRLSTKKRKGGFDFSSEARNALIRIFDAFDVDMDGLLSREEYDLLLQVRRVLKN
jgi:Ca2+-binding EF-hand superfamily protein